MVFPLSDETGIGEHRCSGSRRGRRTFACSSGLGPAGTPTGAISIHLSSRLIGGSGYPTSASQGPLHPACWRRIGAQTQRNASPDL